VERFVLNALANGCGLPPDIRAFGDPIGIVFGEADPPPGARWNAPEKQPVCSGSPEAHRANQSSPLKPTQPKNA
jgi:hypothetical protein